MKITIVTALAALLTTQSAKSVAFTEIGYTGDWRDGVSVSWLGDNVFLAEQELFSNRYVVVQAITEGIGEIPDPFVGLSFGISFTDEPGPLEIDLALGFFLDDGEIFQDNTHIPVTHTVVTSLLYDEETGNGTASWEFIPTNVPDTACSLGLLALGVIVLARFRRN